MILFKDKLKTKLDVGKNGRYDWHVNPSTRPLVDPRLPDADVQKRQAIGAGRVLRNAPGPTRSPAATPRPRTRLLQRPPVQGPERQGHRQRQGDGERSRGQARLSDWDIKVFADSDGDGTSEGETKVLGSSARRDDERGGDDHRRTRVQAGQVRRPRRRTSRRSSHMTARSPSTRPRVRRSSRASRSGSSRAARRRAGRSRRPRRSS